MTPRVGLGAAVLLGAGCVVWAAVPLIHAGYPDLALLLASLGAAMGGLRLALAAITVPEGTYQTAAMQYWIRFLRILQVAPWEESTLIAVLWLEVLHPARPWHTAVLGAALIAYLLATHLAESGASPRVLRPQVRVLAIGVVLLALGAGAGMLPAAATGAGSTLLRLVAAGALIAGAVLALPYVARRETPAPAVHSDRPPGRERENMGRSVASREGPGGSGRMESPRERSAG